MHKSRCGPGRGDLLEVFSVDKFPKMTDYVVPAGVRIADSARIRLGAYIGEVPSAWVFVAEHAPAGRRGYALGFLQAGLTFGYLIGALTATLLAQLFTPAEILDYAWRYPFLLGGVFGDTGSGARNKIGRAHV